MFASYFHANIYRYTITRNPIRLSDLLLSNTLCFYTADNLCMGHFSRGDVVIAPVACEDGGGVKTRPSVVIGTREQGYVYICPVSSKPSSDAPCIPISLDDFSEGGLDLFNESFVLTSRVRVIRSGDVIGKRGKLTKESLSSVLVMVPQSLIPGNETSKGKKGSRSKR